MNQDDLMNENDWLEKALQRQERYIADDGFTDSVLACLPAAETRSVSVPESTGSSHEWIVMAAAGIAAATVAVCFPLMPFIDLITVSARIPVIAGGAAVAAGALFAASQMMRRAL